MYRVIVGEGAEAWSFFAPRFPKHDLVPIVRFLRFGATVRIQELGPDGKPVRELDPCTWEEESYD